MRRPNESRSLARLRRSGNVAPCAHAPGPPPRNVKRRGSPQFKGLERPSKDLTFKRPAGACEPPVSRRGSRFASLASVTTGVAVVALDVRQRCGDGRQVCGQSPVAPQFPEPIRADRVNHGSCPAEKHPVAFIAVSCGASARRSEAPPPVCSTWARPGSTVTVWRRGAAARGRAGSPPICCGLACEPEQHQGHPSANTGGSWPQPLGILAA